MLAACCLALRIVIRDTRERDRNKVTSHDGRDSIRVRKKSCQWFARAALSEKASCRY
jgi:hypothetical protein